MSEQEKPKVKNPPAMLLMHGIVIAIVVYMFWQILQNYLAGGPDAPSLTTLIISAVVLLGGSVYVGYLAVKLYLQCREDARKEKERLQEPPEEEE